MAFEPLLADADQEQDPDRWCSHAPAGQEAWQIISQWVWNLRLELGHMLEPTARRTTEFAPPVKESTAEPRPVQGYGKPTVALPWKAQRFSGQDFALQSRAQRAHSRLSWDERLARNARAPTASQVTIRLFGVPEGFAISLGLVTA